MGRSHDEFERSREDINFGRRGKRTFDPGPVSSAAPGAVGAAKALARALGPRIDQAVIDETIRRLADTWEGTEAAAGIAAFFAKRPAQWASKKGTAT